MVNPLAETILTPPQTAPAAPGHLDNLSRPPTRGALSKPNRGFRGRFITREGRVLSPSDMAGAVERLSNTGHNIADLQLMLAQYAHLPKQKTCLGKEFITPEEVRLPGNQLALSDFNPALFKLQVCDMWFVWNSWDPKPQAQPPGPHLCRGKQVPVAMMFANCTLF